MIAKTKLFRQLLAEIKQLQFRLSELGLPGLVAQEAKLKKLTNSLKLPMLIRFKASTVEKHNPKMQLKALAAEGTPARKRIEGELKDANGWGGVYISHPLDPKQNEFVTDPTVDDWRPRGPFSSKLLENLWKDRTAVPPHLEEERDIEKRRAAAVLEKWNKAVNLWVEEPTLSPGNQGGSTIPVRKGPKSKAAERKEWLRKFEEITGAITRRRSTSSTRTLKASRL